MLLLSDHGVERAGLLAGVEEALTKAGCTVATCLEVEAEPSVASVAGCLQAARDAGAELVVGLGGGSAMDTAKAVALLLRHPGTVEDYLGTDRVPGPGAPTICLPTTAGTGAEITRNALFYVPQRRSKEAIVCRTSSPRWPWWTRR